MLAAAASQSFDNAVTRVERISAAEFSLMNVEWNELVHSSKSDCLFLSWEWLNTWWDRLSEKRELAIVAVRSGDLLVGLAPLAISQPTLTRPLPEAQFLGSGFVGSDYVDFVIREGYAEDVIRALTGYLGSLRVAFKWTNLRKGDCEAERFAETLGRAGWTSVETQVNVSPFISLKGQTWDSYLASLGSEHRYNLNRKTKRLHRDFTVRLELAGSRIECAESVDRLIELHNLRWQNRAGGSDAFHLPELVQFHRDLAPLAFDQGWLRIFTLWADDRAAACLYGFLYNRTFYFYQSGFHPDFEKHSVGLVLMGMAIRHAIGDGAEEYDFLHGNEPYKKHWADQARDLSRLEIYPPTTLGWVSRSSKTLARDGREFLRRIQSMGSSA
jgi:CelD/BcsL family acetyltransferase involved in cellulose biosynthesis